MGLVEIRSYVSATFTANVFFLGHRVPFSAWSQGHGELRLFDLHTVPFAQVVDAMEDPVDVEEARAVQSDARWS